MLLDTLAWDLVLDVNANWAVAAPPYAVAQDVASACRTFLGELWYDTTQGVPYWKILGQRPTLSYVKAQLVAAAEAVPGVTSAQAFITKIVNRELFGQVQIMTTSPPAKMSIEMQGLKPWYVSGYSTWTPN